VIDHDEIARIKRLTQQQRENEKAKFIDIDRDKELEGVWVAHVWVPSDPKVIEKGEWVFAGFRRRRHRRKPQTMNQFFSKIRRKLGLDKRAPVLLTDLQSAARLVRGKDQAWRTRPPQFQKRIGSNKKMVVAPGPKPLGTTTKRSAEKYAYKFDKRKTAFVCLGKNAWDRKPGYLYLGPLAAVFRSDAVREADRLFRSHTELLIIPADLLSVPLRNQMHSSKRIRAGVSRIEWPEPIPEFDPLWAKLVKSKKADELESDQYYIIKTVWFDADCPWLSLGWLRKAIKKHTPSIGVMVCAPNENENVKTISPSSRKRSSVRSKHGSGASRRPAAMRARKAA